jgi:PAS domain S-box-containing protein
MLSNLNSMKFLDVSEGSQEVIGYASKEIIEAGANFIFQIVHPEDLPHCLQMISISWEFMKKLPPDLKESYVSNFYYRAIRKDGTIIKVQLQVLPLETDSTGNVVVTGNILTDISHLELSDQVKLTIVNSSTNACFSATGQEPLLSKELAILSKREIEILKLLTQGLSSKEIADKLMISFYTVRTHRKNILAKLDKKNTPEMISYALFNNII